MSNPTELHSWKCSCGSRDFVPEQLTSTQYRYQEGVLVEHWYTAMNQNNDRFANLHCPECRSQDYSIGWSVDGIAWFKYLNGEFISQDRDTEISTVVGAVCLDCDHKWQLPKEEQCTGTY